MMPPKQDAHKRNMASIVLSKDEAILAPLKSLPAVRIYLLTRGSAIAQDFKKKSRACNSVLSFTSVNVDLDNKCHTNEEY